MCALRKFITFTVLIFRATAAHAGTLSPEEAVRHVGENATVCGVVASTNYAARATSAPTFLDLGKPYPNQVFTAVTFGSDQRNSESRKLRSEQHKFALQERYFSINEAATSCTERLESAL
jgi:hypothetical protein